MRDRLESIGSLPAAILGRNQRVYVTWDLGVSELSAIAIGPRGLAKSLVRNGDDVTSFHRISIGCPISFLSMAFDEKAVLALDSWLEPFLPAITHRYQAFTKWKNTIQEHEGGYDSFTKGFLKFGLNVKEDASIVYREWAPNATEAVFIGDFSSS